MLFCATVTVFGAFIMQPNYLSLLLPFLVVVLSLCADATSDHALDAPVRFAPRTEDMPAGRQLTAARALSRLRTRDISGLLTREQKLHYIDGMLPTSCSSSNTDVA